MTAASVSAPAVVQVARPTTVDEFFAALPTNQTASVRGTKPFVLTSEQAFQKSLRLVAESMGARTVGVLSRHALIVEASPAARACLAADGRFKTADEFLPMRKVARELAAEVASGAETVQVAFLTLAPEDRLVVQRRVTAKGGAILEGCINDGDSFRATVPAACVAELAACGDVRWMEKFERPHFMNDLAVEPEAMNVRAIWKSEDLPEGLSGAGQIVTTSDTGIDSGNLATLHEDLRDRVLGIKVVSNPQCDTTDVNGHGTHTAGSIVGNGTKSGGQIRGTAWGANLYAWFCCGPGGHVYLPNTPDELFRNKGAWDAYIHSASWGSNSNGAYDSECRSYDGWTWKNPEFLPVYSAGNEGSGRCTIGSPAAAKNVLTVGSTQNLRSGSGHSGWWNTGNPKITAEYSSRGPCADGRIKPDIATPGSAILSTRSHGVNYSYGNYDEFYAYDFGTSMACPLMAGNVALVREWLMRREEFSDADGRRPTAALMKAIVTGGAKDAAKPNNEQGWGRADIKETLYPSGGRAVKLVDRIPFAEGEVFEYVVETTNSAPLDVQLVWVDFPGLVDGQPALVNDLDLTVEALEGGDGTVLYGNGGTAPDTLNNVESVRVASAAPDKYIITVTCSHITHDHTEGGAAALYVRGAFDPDYEPTDLDRVRIRRTGETYTTLDKAIAEIQAGDTVEVLSPVRLRKAVEIPVNCTIVATNADAAASAVTFLSDASLTVPEGVRVLFTNVVFAVEQTGTPVIHVASNGVAAVAGCAEVGEIQPEDEKGVELAAPVENFVYVRCPVAQELGQVFGFVTCDRTAAAACAAKFLNAYEAEYGGEVTDDGKLRWVRVPVDPAIASAYHTDDGGANRMYYLHLHKIFGEKDSGDVVVIRNCTLEAPAEVSGAMRLVCTNEAGAATITFDANAGATFYVEPGASLNVSNLVFTGATGDGAFVVKGGELTLDDGTLITDCGDPEAGYVEGETFSSAVTVRFDDDWTAAGKLTMLEGSVISNCTTVGFGGGVYVGGGWDDQACGLDLFGGQVVNCSAGLGGGVYAESGSDIRIKGASTVDGCVSGDDGFADNLYLSWWEDLELADELTGRVGVKTFAGFSGKGDVFGYIAEACGAVAATNSAARFWNDQEPDLHGAVGEDSDGNRVLVWSDEPIQKDVPPLEYWVARVIYTNDVPFVTNEFASLNEALDSVKADAIVEINPTRIPAEGDDPVVGEEAVGEVVNSVAYLERPAKICHDVLLRTADGSTNFVYRSESVTVTVVQGAKLTLSRVGLFGKYPTFSVTEPPVEDPPEEESPAGEDPFVPELTFAEWVKGGLTTMIAVEPGGELVMEDGSCIVEVRGSESRDAVAVSVDRARFTMKDGSSIADCICTFKDSDDPTKAQAAPAGGVIVEGVGARFDLVGGKISSCAGVLGGGAYVSSGAEIYVSGASEIVDNFLLKGMAPSTTNANLSVGNEAASGDAERGHLYLAGEFTGSIGILEPRLYREDQVVGVDTNVFGRLAEGLMPMSHVASAANFTRDNSGATGKLALSGDPKNPTLLVWTTALSDGTYTDPKTGEKYDDVEDFQMVDYPVPVLGLIYDGTLKTGVVEHAGYTLTGNTAIDVGDYMATATLDRKWMWSDGTVGPVKVNWSIAENPTPPPPPPTPTEIDPPTAVTGLIYNGNEQTGVVVNVGFTLTGNVGTNAGPYTAVATPAEGYCWTGGSTAATNVEWSIAKATYDMSGVVFTNVTYICDGTAKSNLVDEATLPAGVSVTNYLNNGQTEIGEYAVTAQFGGDEVNYEPVDDMTATLTIIEDPTPPPPPAPTEIDPPTAVTGLIYNGNEQTGVVVNVGFTLTGNVAINAGDYTAVAMLAEGYCWTGGSTAATNVEWSIAKATYDMSGVVFTNVTYICDGTAKSNLVDEATLPAGVSVTNYLNNGQTEIGEYTVTAQFGGDEVNYEPIADMTATLTIIEDPTPPPPPPPPPPEWDVITNHPTPIAFQSIDRVSDTEWKLVVTNRVEYCNYRLIWTTDLTKGFTSTGAWEHAVGPAASPTWTTNVLTTGGAWFWRAEGADGTNMVQHVEK